MKKAQCGECGRAGGYPLYCMRCAEEMLKQPEQRQELVGLTDEEVSQVIEMGLGVRDSIETALEKLQDKNSC